MMLVCLFKNCVCLFDLTFHQKRYSIKDIAVPEQTHIVCTTHIIYVCTTTKKTNNNNKKLDSHQITDHHHYVRRKN